LGKPPNPVAIVQARLGSTRLPRKVLADVCGKTLIERQMDRLQRSKILREIVVAIPTGEADDDLAEFVKAKRWRCFRGSPANVLSRYNAAAKRYKADPVVRVTMDCPLIDWSVVDSTIAVYLGGGFDYVSNNLDRTFPHGLDVEVFSATALRAAHKKAKDVSDREHVTEWIRRHQDRPFRLGNLRYPIETTDVQTAAFLIGSRLTVDYPEDLELVRAIYSAFPEKDYVTIADVMALFSKNPELLKINVARAEQHLQEVVGFFEPVSEDRIEVEKIIRETSLKAVTQKVQ
jgi:spore coat polysaccharide biosynthesis protein SpsF